jgi:hypothetical protein
MLQTIRVHEILAGGLQIVFVLFEAREDRLACQSGAVFDHSRGRRFQLQFGTGHEFGTHDENRRRSRKPQMFNDSLQFCGGCFRNQERLALNAQFGIPRTQGRGFVRIRPHNAHARDSVKRSPDMLGRPFFRGIKCENDSNRSGFHAPPAASLSPPADQAGHNADEKERTKQERCEPGG